MKTVSRVAVGVFVGSVLAALPISYIFRYGMDQSFHGFAATIAGAALVLGGVMYIVAGDSF